MAEGKNLPEGEQPKEKAKTPWQITKESWYDKLHLNVRQLDIIIAVCWILLIVTGILIYLDVKDIFHLFG